MITQNDMTVVVCPGCGDKIVAPKSENGVYFCSHCRSIIQLRTSKEGHVSVSGLAKIDKNFDAVTYTCPICGADTTEAPFHDRPTCEDCGAAIPRAIVNKVKTVIDTFNRVIKLGNHSSESSIDFAEIEVPQGQKQYRMHFIDIKCPHCGDEFTAFETKNGIYYCNNCDSLLQSDMKPDSKFFECKATIGNGYVHYTCDHCGNEFERFPDIKKPTCPWCGTPVKEEYMRRIRDALKFLDYRKAIESVDTPSHDFLCRTLAKPEDPNNPTWTLNGKPIEDTVTITGLNKPHDILVTCSNCGTLHKLPENECGVYVCCTCHSIINADGESLGRVFLQEDKLDDVYYICEKCGFTFYTSPLNSVVFCPKCFTQVNKDVIKAAQNSLYGLRRLTPEAYERMYDEAMCRGDEYYDKPLADSVEDTDEVNPDKENQEDTTEMREGGFTVNIEVSSLKDALEDLHKKAKAAIKEMFKTKTKQTEEHQHNLVIAPSYDYKFQKAVPATIDSMKKDTYARTHYYAKVYDDVSYIFSDEKPFVVYHDADMYLHMSDEEKRKYFLQFREILDARINEKPACRVVVFYDIPIEEVLTNDVFFNVMQIARQNKMPIMIV